MNVCMLIGRLTKDPETRYAGANQTAISNFTLAVDRKIKSEGQPTADFINCICFGKTAEFMEKHITKGTKLAVQGSWQTGSYKNKEGKNVYTNQLACNVIEFCESRAAAQQANNEVGTNPFAQPSSQPQASPFGQAPSNDGFMKVDDSLDGLMPFA